MEMKMEMKVIEDALDEIKNKEMDIYREIGFLNSHKFKMEVEAMRYKAEAYADCWLIVSSALDKLKNL